MTHAVRGLGLAASLVFVSTLGVVTQANAQSTTAYVYLQSQGPAGPVYGFSADSNGQLAAISGSPFKTGTKIVGGNGTQFFTMGQTLLHSWAVGSTGAIGSQKSQIGFLNYAGSSCGGGTGGIGNAVLDHTGQYIYVLLQNGGDGSCAAYQTYKINSDGSFTFVGDTEKTLDASTTDSVGLPSILGGESFGYASEWVGHYTNLIGFRRASTGELQLMQFNETDPTLAGSNYLPAYPDASPTGKYVVVQLYPNDGGGDTNPPQIGSYSVDSQGNISTANTSSNMPTSQLTGPSSMSFSPDGKMLAIASLYGAGQFGNGVEIYNFNGASPLTLNTRLLNGTPIDQVAWDATHHLYAISRSESKLWVFEIGASSTAQTALVSIPSPLSMVVVRQASGPATCTPPSGYGISVCSPSQGAVMNSPVLIDATAAVSGGVYRFEVWSGSTKLASVDNGTMHTTVSLAPGSYKLTFDAYNSGKTQHEYATRDITVK